MCLRSLLNELIVVTIYFFEHLICNYYIMQIASIADDLDKLLVALSSTLPLDAVVSGIFQMALGLPLSILPAFLT